MAKVNEVVFSLLTHDDPTLAEERRAAPFRLELAGPLAGFGADGGGLPSLLLEPPGELSFTLPPDTPRGAELRVALGLPRVAYELDLAATVRFEVLLDEEPRVELERPIGRAVTADQRVWARRSIPVAAGQALRLRATRSDDGPALPEGTRLEAAFGLLDVVASVEVERATSSPEEPNLVLIVIDALRADRLGFHGYGKDLSPNLDELARRGTVFERVYAPAPWTWPSVASLFTGRTPPAHGVVDSLSCFLAHDDATLAERLRAAGLATVACSTNPLITRWSNFDQGFDAFHETHFGDAFDAVKRVSSWVRERGGERFFLYLHLTEPHGPYEPRADLAGAWIPPEAPDGWRRGILRELLPKRYTDPELDEAKLFSFRDHGSALYDAEIATVDVAVGELLDLLRASGQLEKTIVVVTSDHGEEFLDHGMTGHSKQLYEESVHVPLLLAGPGLPATRVRRPAELRHLGGTLLDLLEVDRGSFPAGPNLLEPGAGISAAPPFFFHTQLGAWNEWGERPDAIRIPLYAVRDGDLLLLWRPGHAPDTGDEATRLFDVVRDPEALHDLSESRPEVTEQLRRMLQAWLESEGARRRDTVTGGTPAKELLEGIGYIDED